MREWFMINPDVIFLNHGSFGACPKPVFEEYQNWQRKLEWQPVEFIARQSDGYLDEARAALCAYVNCDLPDLVFVPNSTTGVNIIARSLGNRFLKPGDEILATNHEYGACELTWDYVCRRSGAVYVRHTLPDPLTTHADFVESFWSSVTPHTKVIFLSHITSPTGLIFPVEEICRRAREAGILTVIDGAHVPGQLALDLKTLDPDFYTGNCHKWLCAPKGSALLYVRREHHKLIEPSVISWGWSEEATLVQRCQQQATRELAQYLAVPAAIAFQAEQGWDMLRAQCIALTHETRERMIAVLGTQPPTTQAREWIGQMAAVPLPDTLITKFGDPTAIKDRLYNEFRIEIPISKWYQKNMIRVSFQAYNTRAEADALIAALETLLHAG